MCKFFEDEHLHSILTFELSVYEFVFLSAFFSSSRRWIVSCIGNRVDIVFDYMCVSEREKKREGGSRVVGHKEIGLKDNYFRTDRNLKLTERGCTLSNFFFNNRASTTFIIIYFLLSILLHQKKNRGLVLLCS